MQENYQNNNAENNNSDQKSFINKIKNFINEHKTASIIISICFIILVFTAIFFSKNNSYNIDADTMVKDDSIYNKEKGAIIGKITDSEKKPIESAKIFLSKKENPKIDYDKDPDTTSDKYGSFILEKIDPNSYYILVIKDNTASIIERDVKANTETNADTIVLTPYKELKGIIYDKNKNPLADTNISITISKWGNIIIPNITSENGEYIFPYIPIDSDVTINIEKEGYENSSKTINSNDITETSLDFTAEKSSSATNTNNSTSSSDNDSSSSDSSDDSTSSSSDSSTDSSSDSSDDSSDDSDSSASYTEESVTLAGYSMTVTRPNDNNSYPGILLLNGLSAGSLAPSGFYVVTGTVDSTEAASSIIDAMKSQDKCTSSVGVAGFSWGGGMTMEISARTGKVTAGVEMSGLIHPSQGIDLSAGDIPNPMLFMTGELDDLAPASDTEDMYNQHTGAGRAGSLYIVPGAGHGYSGSDVYSQVISFFQSYL